MGRAKHVFEAEGTMKQTHGSKDLGTGQKLKMLHSATSTQTYAVLGSQRKLRLQTLSALGESSSIFEAWLFSCRCFLVMFIWKHFLLDTNECLQLITILRLHMHGSFVMDFHIQLVLFKHS